MTASLANLVMKMWDYAFLKLAEREREREGVKIKLYLRYIDDCRAFLKAIKKGWVWRDNKICFSKNEYDADGDTEEDKIKRTTKLITGMKCAKTDNIRFTGEDSTQFCDATLPT